MVDENLANYIRDCLRSGYSIDSIKQTLIGQGWGYNQIEEAINYVQGYAQPAPAPNRMPAARPTGVTVICILGFLSSVLMLVTGILALGLAGIMGGMGISVGGLSGASSLLGGLGSLLTIISLIPLVTGAIGLVAFYLLLKMKRIGWIIVTVLGIISIVLSVIQAVLVGFDIFSIALGVGLWAIILGYLWTKRKLFV